MMLLMRRVSRAVHVVTHLMIIQMSSYMCDSWSSKITTAKVPAVSRSIPYPSYPSS